MAHFSRVNSSNVVISVVVVADSDAPNEAAGISFLGNQDAIFGAGTWVQTSYNTFEGKHYTFNSDGVREYDGGTGLRKNFGSVGSIYDATLDAFYEPQPFASWTLDSNTATWQPPVAYPGGRDGDLKKYQWDEGNTRWVEIDRGYTKERFD